MLYRFTVGNAGAKDLKPLPFLDFGDLGKIEKDLEDLLATHLLDVLFEDATLMPVFQERPMQAEARCPDTARYQESRVSGVNQRVTANG